MRRRRVAMVKSIEERIAAWLDAIPGAISGAGGHNRTFRVACQLFNGWGLSETKTLGWLEHYNDKCQPPWSAPQLKHKASEAAKAKHTKPRGHLVRDEARFHTRSVPIQQPVKDTRQPVRGTLTNETKSTCDTSFAILNIHANDDDKKSLCEKSPGSVTSAPNSEKTDVRAPENLKRSVTSVPDGENRRAPTCQNLQKLRNP
jgi:hypothetical protein